MLHRFLAPTFVAVLFCAGVPFAGEKDQEKGDNPFRTVKVGDFAKYKMTTKLGEKDIEGMMKMVVTAKDEKTAKLKTSMSLMGLELPGQESSIDLTKPFDVTGALVQGKKAGKFEKTGEGKEKIKVAGKEYDAQWISGKVNAEAKGVKVDSEVKAWFSKDAPLNGLLKMETKANIANVTMELVESGSAK